jgi:hypothetical protein
MVNLKHRSPPTRVSQMAIHSALSVLRDLPPKHQSDRALTRKPHRGHNQSGESYQNTLLQFFQTSPLAGAELDLSRDRSDLRQDSV